MGVEVKGAGDGVESRTEAVMTIATGIPVGALDGELLVVHW